MFDSAIYAAAYAAASTYYASTNPNVAAATAAIEKLNAAIDSLRHAASIAESPGVSSAAAEFADELGTHAEALDGTIDSFVDAPGTADPDELGDSLRTAATLARDVMDRLCTYAAPSDISSAAAMIADDAEELYVAADSAVEAAASDEAADMLYDDAKVAEHAANLIDDARF